MVVVLGREQVGRGLARQLLGRDEPRHAHLRGRRGRAPATRTRSGPHARVSRARPGKDKQLGGLYYPLSLPSKAHILFKNILNVHSNVRRHQTIDCPSQSKIFNKISKINKTLTRDRTKGISRHN